MCVDAGRCREHSQSNGSRYEILTVAFHARISTRNFQMQTDCLECAQAFRWMMPEHSMHELGEFLEGNQLATFAHVPLERTESVSFQRIASMYEIECSACNLCISRLFWMRTLIASVFATTIETAVMRMQCSFTGFTDLSQFFNYFSNVD